jgi:hypothetical protein
VIPYLITSVLYYTADIEEKTACFYTERMFVSSYESFTNQPPSKHYLQAIEPTTVAVISFDVEKTVLRNKLLPL